MAMKRNTATVLAILMILLAIGLIPIGVIGSILGVGNILNGGVYIKPPASFVVAFMGAGALSCAVLLGWGAWHLLKRA